MKSIKEFFGGAPEAFRNIFRKRRLSIFDPESRNESWHTHISPIMMLTTLVAVIFIIFAVTLTLVAYTPIVNFLPGYRTEAGKSREILMRNIIRIDSLKRRMNEMLTYNENILLVVDGKTPATRTVQNDTLRITKNIIPPSRTDSILRSQMRGDGEYALGGRVAQGSANHGSMNAVAPIDGIISERFNARADIYGIRIASAPEAPVVAVADGTVIASEWTPDAGHCLTVQHDNGRVSIYRNLSATLPAKGQRVQKSEVIGYSGAGESGNEASLFEFELWIDGKPTDPESYIIF